MGTIISGVASEYEMLKVKEPIDIKSYDTKITYRPYELNLEKVKSLDDCKKILKFLCEVTIKPLPSNVEYGGFSEVSEYFNR